MFTFLTIKTFFCQNRTYAPQIQYVLFPRFCYKNSLSIVPSTRPPMAVSPIAPARTRGKAALEVRSRAHLALTQAGAMANIAHVPHPGWCPDRPIALAGPQGPWPARLWQTGAPLLGGQPGIAPTPSPERHAPCCAAPCRTSSELPLRPSPMPKWAPAARIVSSKHHSTSHRWHVGADAPC